VKTLQSQRLTHTTKTIPFFVNTELINNIEERNCNVVAVIVVLYLICRLSFRSFVMRLAFKTAFVMFPSPLAALFDKRAARQQSSFK
jgi:hypothetical protein